MHLNPDVYKRVVAAKLYIDKNIGQALPLRNLAGQAYLSQYHFHRLFTRIYNKTPHRYVTSQRLQAARQLLEDEQKSINAVCSEVGFESLASFSLLFKREIGSSPLDFRKNLILKKRVAKEQPTKLIPHCFLQSYGFSK